MVTIFVFATALAPLVGDDQRNFLVIALSILAVPLVFIWYPRLGRDLAWGAGAICYSSSVSLFRGENDSITTLAYTALFVCSYLALAGSLRSGRISRELVISILRGLLYLYAAVSVLQLIASFLGLPVPNQILSKGLWSYNSLSVEPSHAGRFLSITLLAYLMLVSGGGNNTSVFAALRPHKLPVAAALVSGLLTGSALAALAIPIAILLSLSKRWIVGGVIMLWLLWPAFSHVDFSAVERAMSFLAALPSLDVQRIAEADQSAALRIIPFLIYHEKVSVEQLSFWFGAGLDAIRIYMQGELIGTDDAVMAGFYPGYVISFGIFGTALFLAAFVFRFVTSYTLPVIFLWLLLFVTSAWNVQLFWYGLMLIRVVHHFRRVNTRGMRFFGNRGAADRRRTDAAPACALALALAQKNYDYNGAQRTSGRGLG